MPKIFQGAGTPQQVMDQLIALRKKDLSVEKKKKRWGWASCSTILLVVVLFILGIRFNPTGRNSNLLFGALGIIGAGFVVSLIMYLVYKAKDFDNRKLLLAMDVLNFVKKDMPQKSRCKLTVSFDHYKKHGKLVNQDKAGFWGSTSLYCYEDEWITMQGKLYDGNAFGLSINQMVKRKERRKKKYTKVKEKIQEDILLTLKIDPETYGGMAKITEKIQKGASAAGLSIRKVSFEEGKLKVAARGGVVVQMMEADKSEELTQANTLFQFLFFIYQALGECRTEAA